MQEWCALRGEVRHDAGGVIAEEWVVEDCYINRRRKWRINIRRRSFAEPGKQRGEGNHSPRPCRAHDQTQNERGGSAQGVGLGRFGF